MLSPADTIENAKRTKIKANRFFTQRQREGKGQMSFIHYHDMATCRGGKVDKGKVQKNKRKKKQVLVLPLHIHSNIHS